MPAWLKVRHHDDLKANSVSVDFALLAVHFLREAVAWDGERRLLEFGAAVDWHAGVLS
jgi:hypothetical protein